MAAEWRIAIRDVVDQMLPPGAFTLALTADADTFFETEWPARLDWRFGLEEAARIEQPVLLVQGTNSDAVTPIYGEAVAMLSNWLPGLSEPSSREPRTLCR